MVRLKSLNEEVLTAPRSWSDVTPTWMTTALVKHFPRAVVGSVQLSDLTDGTNCGARAQLCYESGQGPKSVFVKREGRWLNQLALLALGALRSEARLFGSGVSLPLEHPSPYATAIDPMGLATVVVMEDVTLRFGCPNDATIPLTVDQVRSGLRGLARLHATYWNRPLPNGLEFLRPWRLHGVLGPVSRASIARALRLLDARGQRTLLPPDVNVNSLESGFRRWADIARKGPQTVLHGDPHSGNTYSLPGNVTGFYDWQLVRTGNWSHDVGYFISSSLSATDRRAHERDLLESYLADLGQQEVRLPTFVDAWNLYCQTSAFGLGTWLHTLSGGSFQPVEQCLSTIERFAAAYADHRKDRKE